MVDNIIKIIPNKWNGQKMIITKMTVSNNAEILLILGQLLPKQIPEKPLTILIIPKAKVNIKGIAPINNKIFQIILFIIYLLQKL